MLDLDSGGGIDVIISNCVIILSGDEEFVRLLGESGFTDASIEFTRACDSEDARAFLVNTGLDADRIATEVAGRVGAAFVGAVKPAVPQGGDRR